MWLKASLIVALVAVAKVAVAAPFSDIGDFASFSYGGQFTASAAPVTVGTLLTPNAANPAVGGNEELEAVNGMVTTPLSGPLVIAVGAGNSGLFREIDYDRTGISDPASAAGVEMGTLRFTFGDTQTANVFAAGTLRIITLTGDLLMEDLNGFYTTTAGTWVFSGTIGAASTMGTFTTTIALRAVSEPAVLAMVGGAVLALGLVGRRRA